MHSLTHAAHITEGMAMDIVFNACRANPQRETRSTAWKSSTYTVKFEGITDGESVIEHKATVTDANGFVIAHAFVDATDN